MCFCHLDLDSPMGTCPHGAFGGAIPDPEAALYDGDIIWALGTDSTHSDLTPLTGQVTLVK